MDYWLQWDAPATRRNAVESVRCDLSVDDGWVSESTVSVKEEIHILSWRCQRIDESIWLTFPEWMHFWRDKRQITYFPKPIYTNAVDL